MADLLQARELSRSYGKFQALMPTDMTLHSGEIAVLFEPHTAAAGLHDLFNFLWLQA